MTSPPAAHPIGVFDSGIGGLSVLQALRHELPHEQFVYLADSGNAPYGDARGDAFVQERSLAIAQYLLEQHDIKILVIACNTATALAIEYLRAAYPKQKFIGIEPMIKTAAELTKGKIVAVCATPATLASSRYAMLVQKYGSHLTILEPDCSEWAYWIENNQVNREHIAEIINNVCEQGADVIVLGCTHYHWIKELIIELAAGRATVIEPSEAIGRRVQELLELR